MKRRRFGGRDPYRKHLKPTAPRSDDPAQLMLVFPAAPFPTDGELRARPPTPWPWATDEPDIVQYIEAWKEKPKP